MFKPLSFQPTSNSGGINMESNCKLQEAAMLGLCACVLLVFFALNLSHNSLQADVTAQFYEIYLTNNLTSDVNVTVQPIGMIFNDRKEYSLNTSQSHDNPGELITGGSVNITEGTFQGNVMNHINTFTPSEENQNNIGFGKYRVTIGGDFYVDIDFSDADYPGPYSGRGMDRDIFLEVRPPFEVFWLSGLGGGEYQLSDGDLIQLWDQRRINGPNAIKNQNKDGFKIPNISENNPATNIPLGNHTDRGKLFVNADVLSNVTIINDITVANGAWLKIEQPGTQVKFNSGKKLTINGKITAQGTTANRITFTRNGSSGNWGGIKINSGSSSNVSTLRRCDITYATTGISITYTGSSNNVTIDKCRISNNSSGGIFVDGNAYASASVHPILSSNHIHDNSSTGIYLWNYAKPKVTGNRIEYNISSGIYASASSSATVEFNYLNQNESYGIGFVYNTLAQAHRNTVQYNTGAGIYIESSSNVTAYGQARPKVVT